MFIRNLLKMKLISLLALTTPEAKNAVVSEDVTLGDDCIPLVDMCLVSTEEHLICSEETNQVSITFVLVFYNQSQVCLR